MKIIHISDLHFPLKLPLLSLRGKMIAGYTNYTLRRGDKHPPEITGALIDFIRKSSYDVLVISGDLVNVSHELEFANARRILEPVLDERTFMIPGNHDRYMPGAVAPVDLFDKYFGEFTGSQIENQEYLKVKEFAKTAFIGWDSSKPRSLFDAYGEIKESTIENMIQYLKKRKNTEYFLVCHHPLWNPEAHGESNHHKMHDRESIIGQLKNHPPVMVFHGHSHINWVRNLGSGIPFWIVNSASSTRVSDARHETGFHTVEMDRSRIKIRRYAYSGTEGIFTESELIGYDN